MQGIIWLASYPKSGNTWLRAFLTNLLSGRKDPVPLSEMAKLINGESSATWYRKFLRDDFPIDDDVEVSRNRGLIQYRLAAHAQAMLFLKTHSYLGQAHGHDIFNMDATRAAIYIVRNPLDVVVSAAPHFDQTIDQTIEMMANQIMTTAPNEKQVFEKLTDWSTHVKSWTQVPSPSLLVLRYEDLLANPRKHFTKLVRFLNIDVSARQIQQAIRNSSFKSLKSLEQKQGFAERPEHATSFFRKGQTGQWRQNLTKAQAREIILNHHEQMKRFDYIPKDFA